METKTKTNSVYDYVLTSLVGGKNSARRIKRVGFQRFENMLDFVEQVDNPNMNERFKRLHKFGPYYASSDSVPEAYADNIKNGWYGADFKNMNVEDAYKNLTNPNLLAYNKMDLIAELENKFNDSLSTTLNDELPKKKLAYNDLGLGVFSFDMAAQGMYRLNEFYSPSMDKVVSDADVIKIGGNLVHRDNNSIVVTRTETKPDGKPKIRTTNKKVWAYFPKVKRQRASIDLYIGVGNSAYINETEYLYTAIGAMVFTKRLQQASIPVRINAVFGGGVAYDQDNKSKEDKYDGGIVTLKDYNDPVDYNLLAKVTGDVAFGRHFGNKYACMLLGLYANLLNEPKPHNTYVTSSNDLKEYLMTYCEALQRDLNISTPNNIVCFSGAQSMNMAVQDVRSAIDYVNGLLGT